MRCDRNLFIELMDALSAPRASRKTETPQQTKMRGLGIEESDLKTNTESAPSRFPEAAKPRGIVYKLEIHISVLIITHYVNCGIYISRGIKF